MPDGRIEKPGQRVRASFHDRGAEADLSVYLLDDDNGHGAQKIEGRKDSGESADESDHKYSDIHGRGPPYLCFSVFSQHPVFYHNEKRKEASAEMLSTILAGS